MVLGVLLSTHRWQTIAHTAPGGSACHICTRVLSLQVYIPEVNWLLLICTIIVVGVFETSAKIGNGE